MFDNKYINCGNCYLCVFLVVTKEDSFDSVHKCLQFPCLLISIDR